MEEIKKALSEVNDRIEQLEQHLKQEKATLSYLSVFLDGLEALQSIRG